MAGGIKCAHCNRRYKNRGTSLRKRHLTRKVLESINKTRAAKQKSALAIDDDVCGTCFIMHNRLASTAEDRSRSPQKITSRREYSPSDQPMASSSQAQMEEMELSQPHGNEACESAQDFQENPEHEPSKCLRCNNDARRAGPRYVLSDLPLLNILFNGERLMENQTALTGINYLCGICYVAILKRFHDMWRALPMTQGARPLTVPQVQHLMAFENNHVTDNLVAEPNEDFEDEEDTEDDTVNESQESHSTQENETEDDNWEYDNDGDYEDVQTEDAVSDHYAANIIKLPIRSLKRSGNTCCICGKRKVYDRIPKKTRSYIFQELGIYVPNSNRRCADHADYNSPSGLNNVAFAMIGQERGNVISETVFSSEELVKLLNDQSDRLNWYAKYYGKLSFSDKTVFSNKEFKCLTGLNKDQFEYLYNMCSPHLRNTRARSKKDALAMFLVKLRANPSVNAIACLFGTDKRRVSAAIKKVRQILVDKFVPLYLGYNHISRDEYINDKTTELSKTLTGATEGQAIAVIDGTYLYFQKSANYSLQRRMYSMHKFRQLLKVMMIVSSKGYIIDVEGPYYGDGANNDSSILTNMMRDVNGFRSFFQTGDYIVEDRGFRDSNNLLAELGYSIQMPHFLGKRQQHPTHEANESRLCTKIRNVVESVNGRIKGVFRFFRDTIPNDYIRRNRAYQMFRIACAMLNAFYGNLREDQEEDAWVGEQMVIRKELSNLLEARLKDENYIRKTKDWVPVQIQNGSLEDFPRLSMLELRQFTFGVYQLNLSKSYLADSRNELGEYMIYFHKDLDLDFHNVVRFQIQSRHHRTTQYDVWVAYNKNGRGINSITGWYCKCPNGSRVVGCCAHIAAVIWYLSYARYCPRIHSPAADLDQGVRDARNFRYEEEYLDLPGDVEAALFPESPLQDEDPTNIRNFGPSSLRPNQSTQIPGTSRNFATKQQRAEEKSSSSSSSSSESTDSEGDTQTSSSNHNSESDSDVD